MDPRPLPYQDRESEESAIRGMYTVGYGGVVCGDVHSHVYGLLPNLLDAEFIDWVDFDVWLRGRGFTESYLRSLRWSAKKYASCLFKGSFVGVDDFGLKGLANLSKFLGCYGVFSKLKAEAGLKWNTESSEDSFLKIYRGEEVAGIFDWLESVKANFDREIWFPVAFMMLSGLRTSEAILCLNKVAESGLGRYFNSDMGVLEHFTDRRFIRRTKKAFVSVVSERLKMELESWHEKTTYEKLRKRLEKKGIPIRFYDCRKWFATVLRENGVEVEVIDLLSGRLPKKVFGRSYWRPELNSHFEKVREVLRGYEDRLLKLKL